MNLSNPEDMILALDFDGTCVEHVNPPAIGNEIRPGLLAWAGLPLQS